MQFLARLITTEVYMPDMIYSNIHKFIMLYVLFISITVPLTPVVAGLCVTGFMYSGFCTYLRSTYSDVV